MYDARAKQDLNIFILKNPLRSNGISKLGSNYDWLLIVCNLMFSGDISKEGAIEI